MGSGLIIDCFAGGGGASTGIEMALGRSVDIAINHDPKAIAMHAANHPNTLHLTEDIFEVDLVKYVGGRHVSLMWASPDCTHHSRAKGGKPRESGLRMLPWAVHKHAAAVKPDVIFLENVPEIQKWGPLGEDGRPIKERAGEDYAAFVAAMRNLGYTWESRELSACDYGAPTTRKRWYAILRRDGKRTVWPEQTHGETLFAPKPYVPVSSCIDFSDIGQSIFDRKKPLAEATSRRIARGIEQFVQGCGGFIVAGGVKRSLISAFLIKYYGSGTGQSVTDALGTITTKDRFGLVTVQLEDETYAIADIFLRMLRPRELMLAQGFPPDYVIDRYADGSAVPIAQQVKMIGNSVVPTMAEVLVRANCAELIAMAT
ncbi:MAG: DNA cytosine methyltransferase [Raoultibacter sp.]